MSEPTLYSALKDIADAIRAKGVTGTMSAIEMPQKIASIQTGGGYESLPLTFTAVNAPATVSMTAVGSAPSVSLEYSTDNGETWTDFIVGSTTVTLNEIGQSMFLRAKTPNARTATTAGNRNTFSMTGQVVVSGNIASILNKNLEQGKVLDSTLTYHLAGLFNGATGLVGSARNLIFPFDNIYVGSLNEMFKDCTSLVNAPYELLALAVPDSAYKGMFSGCTSLVDTPQIRATSTSGNNSMNEMFKGCSSLTTVCDLLPTSVTTAAYAYMFQNCTSLTTAPELPATTLAQSCYQGMFQGCTSLTTSPSELPTTTLVASSYAYMFSGCSALTSTPEIRAKYIQTSSAAREMFKNCTSLTSVSLDDLEIVDNQLSFADGFNGCTALTSISLPKLHTVGSGQSWAMSGFLRGCTSLVEVSMPALTQIINSNSFPDICNGCTSLKNVDVRKLSSIQSNNNMNTAFNGCTALEVIDFSEATAVPGLSNANAFQNTNSTFQIVVPDALYSQWIVAGNWSSFSSQIVKASEYVPAA